MIKNVFPERLINGESYRIPRAVDLAAWQDLMIRLAQVRQLPVQVEVDEVRLRGSLKSNPGIAVYHPQHRKDYYVYLAVPDQMGTQHYIKYYQHGFSRDYASTIRETHNILEDMQKQKAQARYPQERMYYEEVQALMLDTLSELMDPKYSTVASKAAPKEAPKAPPKQTAPKEAPKAAPKAAPKQTAPKQTAPKAEPKPKKTAAPEGKKYLNFRCPKCGQMWRVERRAAVITHTCSCGQAIRVNLAWSPEKKQQP